MTIKIFTQEVDKCFQCRFLHIPTFEFPTMSKECCYFSPKEVKDASTIPDWCPLPDKTEMK